MWCIGRDTNRLPKLTQNRWFSQKGALANFTANSNNFSARQQLAADLLANKNPTLKD
jgi:hypothetical protein